jgi:hypothetical protein
VKELSDGLLTSQFMIYRKQTGLRKIEINKKDCVTVETIYPTAHGNYFMEQMKMNDIKISEFAYRLICYLFEDNDEIFSQKKFAYLDKLTWSSTSDNIR